MIQKLPLTIFFPCHNEEANVERVTRQAVEVGRRVSDDLQVIVVNDGSRDRTAEIADGLAAELPEVEVIHQYPNRGYGGALQSGFRAAKKRYVFYTDGDGQFDINEIDLLIPLIDRFDIVSGYRLNRQDSMMRVLNAKAWGVLMRVVLGLRVRDIDCAFKLYRREIFDRIEMKSQGALIDAEILARAVRKGYTIGQVGIHHYPRTAGEQTGANFKVILRAFRELFRLRKDIVRSD